MLKCGIFENDITPMLGMGMTGYFEPRPGQGVKERLCSEAVYFENDGSRVVLISNDLEMMTPETHQAIREQIAERLQLPETNIMTCSTHTHTGGPIYRMPYSDITSEDFYNPEFNAFVIRRTVEAAVMAAGEARDVRVRFARGTEDSLAFCRIYRQPDGTLKTWAAANAAPYTDIDDDVSVLCIELPDGTPYGALVNFACHCDCVGGTEFSADYPGILRQSLRRSFGDCFHPVFFNGFCGNINHADPAGRSRQPNFYRNMGRILAADVLRLWELADGYFTDTTIRAEMADVTVPARLPDEKLLAWARETAAKPECGAMDRHFSGTILNMEHGARTEWTVPVQAVRVGQLMFYAAPGEMFTEFSKMLKAGSPLPFVMPINLANAHVEYVPVREVFGYGNQVYEARVGAGLLGPDGGYIMVDKLLELGSRMAE